MLVRTLIRTLLLFLLLLLSVPGCGGASSSSNGGSGDADAAPDAAQTPPDGAAPDDSGGPAPDVAPPDACVPSCGERVCGPDGCGGSCGACDADAVCWDGVCCAAACEGRECGPDGCGGSCGVCDDRTVCLDGACCLPDCRERDCGPDGCGGSCGECSEAGFCQGGHCCVPSCDGLECGGDGCGGSCGGCDAPHFCRDGRCALPDADHDGVPDVADPFPTDPDRPGEAADGVVYGHTAHDLYTLDVKTYQMQRMAAFEGLEGEVEFERRMTDLAIDAYGVVWGVSYLRLYTCHPVTGRCTLMVDLADVVGGDQVYEFNALTMVPAALFGELRDVLVGVSNDGGWYRFDVHYEERIVEVTRLGSYGMGRRSSGDVYSIEGVGTYAAVDQAGGEDDYLIRLDPTTGVSEVEPIAGLDGLQQVFGLAGWTQHAFAFDRSGTILVVDVQAGATVATLVHRQSGEDVALCMLNGRNVGAGNPICDTGAPIEWWGAGVRTRIEE